MVIDDALVDVVRYTLAVALKIVAPVLFAGVVIGLLISIVQSVTQIQEQTLTIVPKIFAMTIVAIVLLPWIISMVAEFSIEMFRID